MPEQMRRPDLKGTLQGTERIRFVCPCGRALHIEEPFRRFDDDAVPDDRNAKLPRLVRPAVFVSRRLEIYRHKFH